MEFTVSSSDTTVLASDELSVGASGRITKWVSEPNIRGTWDIIWTSLVTIFICTHTILCLNVPSPDDTWVEIFRRRFSWMLLAILAPEIVLTYAAGQWSRARQSVESFKTSGHTAWTMRLAFFADMGGFVLNSPDFRQFPLNAKQLHWLVINGHIAYPSVKSDELWDKSKQDRLFRIVTCFQISYLILQCIGRSAQKLAITALELNALGIVICSLMTSFAWLHKPADVRTPIHIHTSTPITSIIRDKEWHTTPLDFIDENGPGFSLNVLPFVNMPSIPPTRPIQRIPNDRFPMNPHGYQEHLLCLATLIFAGIHLIGWNFSFPTHTEKVLWRVSSLLLFGVTALFWILETAASWIRLGRWKWLYYWLFKPKKLGHWEKDMEARLARAEEHRDQMEFPIAWEFWAVSAVALLYSLSRCYLLAESLLEFREIDAKVYVNVQWSAFVPHI
ncbi:hypothetical protein BDZ85DRAFT_274887 [Elsinoe ampelina]|uniref:Uncharacterized protein n=1 Tax=Elsinoe ampelina TaxID=302913 RepID=A0A6A6G8Y2_9PEZI|nr:hypothetical protein BDZ85DRAFT_274887 [Elsinoe ampelina]